MNETFEYLDTEDLVELARRLLGDPPPIRDIGLLGAAAARPQASAYGEDAYPDVWSKAGALLHSVVNNHPLVDGNKRLGWLATAVFLELNNASVSSASNDAVYDLVTNVASTDFAVYDIAGVLCRMNSESAGDSVNPVAVDPMAADMSQGSGVRPAGQSPHSEMIAFRVYDPNNPEHVARSQAESEAWTMLRARGDAAPLQKLGIARPGADIRAAFRNKHTQKQSVKVLEDAIRRGTADPDLGYDLERLRRDLNDAKAALRAAQRTLDQLPDVKPEGIPD